MKKTFLVYIITLVLITVFQMNHSPLMAQDPGTVIDIVILKNGNAITTEKECNDYSILLRKFKVRAVTDSMKIITNVPYSPYGKYKPAFEIFSWDPYRQEVIQLCILHGTDSITISIQDSIKYWWNAFFYFKIPFQKGYYEITELEERNDLKGAQGLTHGYAIPSKYKWQAIPAKKRKLLINGK